jgi:corrinoid protein of di/trimethylamine methyltransferase
MEAEQILEKLSAAIVEGLDDEARALAGEALATGISPMEAIEKGLSKGMGIIGAQFETGEAYLPELLLAAASFNAAMAVLKPAMDADRKVTKLGKILVATVKGDVHSIGKDIVATVLGTSGFEVVDLGVDKSSLNIVEEAEKQQVDMIALSSLMTTTMPAQKEVIDTLREMGIRQKYLVLVGGGPVNQAWADRIGADGYGRSALEAVALARSLMAGRKG